jgi:uncharacterized membrane protein
MKKLLNFLYGAIWIIILLLIYFILLPTFNSGKNMLSRNSFELTIACLILYVVLSLIIELLEWRKKSLEKKNENST